MGDDAAPELLDWGSIDDKDRAFSQLSEAGKIQVSDLARRAPLLAILRKEVSCEKLRGGTMGAGDIKPPAPSAAADVDTGPLEATQIHDGSSAAGDRRARSGANHGEDLDILGASELMAGHASPAASSIAPLSGTLDGPLGKEEHHVSGDIHGYAPDPPGHAPRIGGSLEATAPGTAMAQGAEDVRVVGGALHHGGPEATCDEGRRNNASATSAAVEATRNHGKRKVNAQLSQSRFIASEMHQPEGPNRPIRGAPEGRRSYREAARSRPSLARYNVQSHQHQAQAWAHRGRGDL